MSVLVQQLERRKKNDSKRTSEAKEVQAEEYRMQVGTVAQHKSTLSSCACLPFRAMTQKLSCTNIASSGASM